MREIEIGADEIVDTLLSNSEANGVCILDSCSVGRSGSNLLIAGVNPVETLRFPVADAVETLAEFEKIILLEDRAAIFTISYDFGLDLNCVSGRVQPNEPGVFVALFDHLFVHDYDINRTFFSGNTETMLGFRRGGNASSNTRSSVPAVPISNFAQAAYASTVEEIKELIRSGETYQTNLTQQLNVALPDCVTPQNIFQSLRHKNPAPFAAYVDRQDSVVVSASPEQFLRVETVDGNRRIVAEPIKGTRRRGGSEFEDNQLRTELLNSAKDRAENTMIVDLMRNDLGRVCKFGSVKVEDLCRIEEHPTLFHLVSTVTGTLRDDVGYSDILKATFPCGSITGAPKLRTMEIIERLEPNPRGLSMGAIGCRVPASMSGRGEVFEMSVAIRTIVVRDNTATFNVGGGVVIDSDPDGEYAESMLKAQALLRSF